MEFAKKVHDLEPLPDDGSDRDRDLTTDELKNEVFVMLLIYASWRLKIPPFVVQRYAAKLESEIRITLETMQQVPN